MESFDYNNYRVVGIVENIPASNHSFIHVIGYVDTYSYNIHRYANEAEIKSVFASKGRVFAYKFAQRNPKLSGHCVIFGIIPNERPGEGLDDYVWDRSIDVVDFASPALKIAPDSFSFDGERNYSILRKYNLFDVENDTYVVSNGCVYLVKAHSNERILKYWSFSDLEVKCIDSAVLCRGNLYIFGSLSDNTGVVDITTDEQLVDWFCKKVLKPRWKEFVSKQDYKNVESSIKEVFSSVNLDNSIYNARLNRLKTITTNVQLTLDSLHDISNNPWFSEMLQSAVARFKENYVKEVENAYKEEFKKLKEEHDSALNEENIRFNEAIHAAQEMLAEAEIENEAKIKSLTEQSLQLETEVQKLTETVELKRSELEEEELRWTKVMEKKDSIIEDFSIIKEVLSIGSVSHEEKKPSNTPQKCYSLSAVKLEIEPTVLLQVFMKRLELSLKALGAEESDAENSSYLLSKYNVFVASDMRVIRSIIHATGYCYYLYEYVTPRWTCFEDLLDNGLAYIIKQAMLEPDKLFYLVLRNMNLSYIPSYLQPIIDIQLGLYDTIPSTDLHFPPNLRILGHISDDTLIPVSIYAIEDLGCSKKLRFSGKKSSLKEVFLPSMFLTPQLLNKQKIEQGIVNHVEDYISENE